MPHSTRSESIRNNTTMGSLSADAYTIEVGPEVAGLIASATDYPPINGHPPTNGHLTNGYHLDESNTTEEVQIHSPAHRAATGSSGQPSNHIRASGAGAGTGAVITGTTINGTHVRDITITGTHITGTTISATHISGITINSTNIIQTSINGVPTSTSGTTINGTNNDNNNNDDNLNGTTPISRAPPPIVDGQETEAEAEAAFASTVAASVITSNSINSHERGTAVANHERSGSTSLDTPGITIVYPRAMFNINPTRLGHLLRREFADP
ncbi:hypothetical protein GE21DRAFT_5599 [Neurospora crassa]|uniref:Uncharacterized protein n=1 Tax=Neurospora crassa (strain ATCC 24698 / 74-OR23-1A / CBS 708.71 / DSM 1257 / FGSC 987) TaxID=367110 RepID=Q7S8N3_NEUCR|nr:hypothetical protein NCU06581 [Neurospora crassa OR74A]EAA32705.1 hypothetical protein NCU06581 [Neurospora crassa OR74A]KHE84041.1 hypothetical protein GE21DRAFT_5599 [Neurospora crassa]|eukprot:XP_961941.1 hypothetical protein NCU06581 [Neurospora crassa OR74A]